VGDDDQMYACPSSVPCYLVDDLFSLPIFAVVGMRARSNSPLPQIPPEWESWFDALQLLVKHGGSVHEVVYNRPLATCLIARNDREPRILDFFRLLLSENYYDFGAVVGSKSFSAVQNAIRARGQAYPALKMLTAAGVDVSKLMDDGRSPLHVAAEVAYDVKALEYLCANGSLGDINRQDKWGWTSLHYSILSEYYGSCPVSFAKVQFLLSQGADPNIKAETPLPYLIHKGIPETPFTPAELCSSLKPTILSGYVEALKANGHVVPSDLEDEVFFDAIDYDIGPSICS
jgi:hypothetical protein